MTKRQNIFKFFLALIVVSMLGLGIFLTIDPTRKAIHSAEINTEAEEAPTSSVILQEVDDFVYEDTVAKTICIGLSEAGLAKVGGAFFDVIFPANITLIKKTYYSQSMFGDKSAQLINVYFAQDTSLEAIGWSAFCGCSSLQSITIPNSVKSIGGSAFSGCSKLKAVGIGPNSNLQTIEAYAFANCFSLQSITIPDTVTKIEGMTNDEAFYWCSSLTLVVTWSKDKADALIDDKESYIGNFSGLWSHNDEITYAIPVNFKKSNSETITQYKLFKRPIQWSYNEETYIWSEDENYSFPRLSAGYYWQAPDGDYINLDRLNDMLVNGEITDSITLTCESGKTDISSVEINLGWTEQTFDGNAHEQTIQTALQEGQDFILKYRKGSENGEEIAEFKDAGKYYAKLTGKGNYYGDIILPFEIKPKAITGVTATIAPVTYKGSEFIAQDLQISFEGLDGIDPSQLTYIISTQSGKPLLHAGEYNVTIKFIGNYSGEVTTTLTINQLDLSNIDELLVSGQIRLIFGADPRTYDDMTRPGFIDLGINVLPILSLVIKGQQILTIPGDSYFLRVYNEGVGGDFYLPFEEFPWRPIVGFKNGINYVVEGHYIDQDAGYDTQFKSLIVKKDISNDIIFPILPDEPNETIWGYDVYEELAESECRGISLVNRGLCAYINANPFEGENYSAEIQRDLNNANKDLLKKKVLYGTPSWSWFSESEEVKFKGETVEKLLKDGYGISEYSVPLSTCKITYYDEGGSPISEPSEPGT